MSKTEINGFIMSEKPSTLTEISIYPIKSIQGNQINKAFVEKQGIEDDRRFLIADLDGKMITARKYPSLVKITSQIMGSQLILNYGVKDELILDKEAFNLNSAPATVWGDTFDAYTTSSHANQWFSDIIGKPVQLLYLGEVSNRWREKLDTEVSFADGYPLLIISQASLDDLNERSPQVHKMAQFRPNLVVSGEEPFIEDSWKKIRIGTVVFELRKPCQRCILTTVDSDSGEFNQNKEPLNTLLKFRADENREVYFGQNMIALNEGTIHVGDEIEVIEYKNKEKYLQTEISISSSSDSVNVDPQKSVTIDIDGREFIGDNSKTLLVQAEQAGVDMPNSCRAGLCGACMVKVTEGEVQQERVPAITQRHIDEGYALACSCVPKSDIKAEVGIRRF